MHDKEQQDPDTGVSADAISANSAVAPAAANDAASETNFAADLEKQLGDALSETAKLKDALLRAAADIDNMRKRAQADVANAHKFGLENFSSELLPIKDSLEAALAIDSASLDSYKDGIELTLKQLVNAFGKFNIKEINPVGEKFDPHRHQAITLVDSEQEPNTVVSVMQKGYQLNDRILRPALVTVAKSKTDA